MTPVTEAADRLEKAALTHVPCQPVRDLLPAAGISEGYAVQSILTDRAIASGRRPVGRKVGLTSPAVQRQLGVDQPDFGVLFEDMTYRNGETIATELLLQPRIEAEIAFVLGADLTGALSLATVRRAIDYMVAALEIVDSRIAGWDITLVDTIADNASSGLFALGKTKVPLGSRDLTTARMIMIDATGASASSGTGADCLGDPVAALLWLARTAQDFGGALRAGDIVLSGALGPMVPVVPGSTFTAHITGVGNVSATFENVPTTLPA